MIANKHILKQDLSSFAELARSQMSSNLKYSHAEFRLGFFPCMKTDDLTSPPHRVRRMVKVFGGSVSAAISKIQSVGKAYMQLAICVRAVFPCAV